MPLIIITGLPTSGKSHRAKQLHGYLEKRTAGTKFRLHLISDESLSISRDVYDLSPGKVPAHTRSANASEKDARAALYGAVKRVLSDRDIVILDGLNYIGGWRYQLYCEAKALQTPSCVLQIGCSEDWARQRNEERLQRQRATGTGTLSDGQDTPLTAEAYEENNWKELVMRYEEPNPMKAWDSPLFTMIPDDDEAQADKVFDSMWEAVAGEGRKIIRPNQATVQRSRDAGGDYLYMLDRETQDIVKRVLEQQSEEGGGEVKIPLTPPRAEGDLIVELPGRKMGLPQLQRLRRAYIGLNRGGIGLEAVGNMSASRIRESFVWYLNDTFQNEE